MAANTFKPQHRASRTCVTPPGLLASNHEQLRLALDSSGLALWDWNVRTGRFLVDERMHAMLGYQPGEVVFSNNWLVEHLHPDDYPRLQQAAQDVLKGVTDLLVLEHRIRHKTGHWVWILGRGKVAERDRAGQAVRMVGTDADISERKRLEIAARESQDLLKNMTDQVPAELFAFQVHPDGRSCFPYASKHFLDFYGLTLAQVQADASPVFAWQHPDDADMIRRSIAAAVAQLKPWNLDYRLRLPNGAVCWRSGHAVPHRQLDGSVVFHGAIFDITARKLGQESVRVAAVAFESSSAMMVSDAQRRILRVNSAFVALSGFGQAEVVGRPSGVLRSGRHDARFYAQMWHSIHSTGHWAGEIWNRRKNGDVFLDWMSISVVKDDLGQVTHYVSVHYDITLRKRTEEEIRQLAFFDPLTQLPNRRLMLDRLQQLCAAFARNGQIGAVLFIDLDRFKLLNDTHGHHQGDLLLQQTARRLQDCVREVDTVARLGGDEFVVALAQLGLDADEARRGAMGVARKVLEALAKPFVLTELHWHLSACVGVALLAGVHQQPEELLKDADQAMYAAKAAGRNAVRLAPHAPLA
jgi:diguanylate cyclase (GGDEF)-like protein/PAS domain S-box-containing protein